VQEYIENVVDIPFVARVHALVDLIDQSEGRACQTLQGHKVEDRGDGALATGLTVVVEDGERFGFTGFVVSTRSPVKVCQQKLTGT
jgi:hypothetical protein